MTDINIKVIPSCGNVFEDLGLPYPGHLQLKSSMIMTINKIIEHHKYELNADLSKITNLSISELNKIWNLKSNEIPAEKLIEAINKLGYSIKLDIAPREPQRALLDIKFQRK